MRSWPEVREVPGRDCWRPRLPPLTLGQYLPRVMAKVVVSCVGTRPQDSEAAALE